ncbi:uncharacterized protein LOC121418347 [Lytechinus variegatus]|uniref:uncharacterized protein LOC121418347 n=1 Tax=Lytechinus variegatus TaxID=7654 RepID=UPI001BB1D419|nr:uncharacterized protein LOC121418347 [Lytechinus variegatus]
MKMNVFSFAGYFRNGFVISFCRKSINFRAFGNHHPFPVSSSVAFPLTSGNAGLGIAPAWRSSGYSSPRILLDSLHSSRVRTELSVRFTTSYVLSHFQQTSRARWAHDSSSQTLKSENCFSTIPLSCPWRQHHLKLKFLQVRLANVCLYRNFSSTRFLSSNPASTQSSSGQPVKDDQDHRSVLHQLKKLENSLRFHGYSTIRIGVGVFIIIGLMVYILRDPIRENVAVEVSQVASRSLEHEHVAMKAEEFAKSLLQTLLHDENMHRLATQFIKQVLNSPETRKATTDYISSILEDPQNRRLLASTIKQVLLLAIHDPETTAALKAVVVLILSDPESQKAARGLITAVFKHDDLKAAAALFFADVLQSQAVVKQATKLGKDVTFNIITDPNLKEETGKSFWEAVKYSITPRWFSGATSSSSSSSEPSADSSEIHPSSSSLSSNQDTLPPSPLSSSSSLPSQLTSSEPLSSQPSSPLPSSSPSSSLPSPESSPSSPESSPSISSLSPPSPSTSLPSPPPSKPTGESTTPSPTEGELFEEQQLLDEQGLDEDSNILT